MSKTGVKCKKMNRYSIEQLKAALMVLKNGLLSKHAQNLLQELGSRSIDRLWVRRELGFLGKWKGDLPMSWELPRQ